MPTPLYSSLRESFSRDVYMAECGLISAPVVTLELDSASELPLLSGDTPPQNLILHVSRELLVVDGSGDAIAPLYDVLSLARRSIPILVLDSLATVAPLAEFTIENNLCDVLLAASYENGAVLRAAYKEMPLLRGILDCRAVEVDLHALVGEATEACASAVILRPEDATADAVHYLNTRFLRVIASDAGGFDSVAARGTNGILTKDLAGAYRFLASFPEGSSLQRPGLVAHKGFTNGTTYPENTISATAAAGKASFDASEIDVKLTTDGVAIVTHNPTTKDMFLGDPIVPEESDYETVSALRRTAFPNEGIDRFDDLMTAMKDYPDTPVVIELKPQAKYHKLEALTRLTREILARDTSQKNCVIIMGTLDPGLKYVRNRLPSVPISHCEGGKSIPDAPIDRHEAEDRLYRIALITEGCVAGYNCEESKINRRFNEYAKLRMLTVFPWSYGYSTWENNGPRHVDTFLSGYTMWTTDHGQHFFDCPIGIAPILPSEARFTPRATVTMRDGRTATVTARVLTLSGKVTENADGTVTASPGARVMLGYTVPLPFERSYTFYGEPFTVNV